MNSIGDSCERICQINQIYIRDMYGTLLTRKWRLDHRCLREWMKDPAYIVKVSVHNFSVLYLEPVSFPK